MLETVFNILKISVIAAVVASFTVAIFALISFFSSVIFGNIIGEIFGWASMYMPFNASTIFVSIGLAISAILAFLIAKKIFDLTSWSISAI